MEPADLRGAHLEPAAGRLLVAAPLLRDPHFVHTIVLLLDVDDDGVLGVVLNRPGDVAVADVLEPWQDTIQRPGVVFHGGPVGTDSALGIARLRTGGPEPAGWRPLFGTTGLVDLEASATALGPSLESLRIYAGYAGWSRGQLEEEIAEGAWYVVAGHPGDGFTVDPQRLWRQVLRRQPGRLAWLATYPVDPTRN